MLNKFSQRSPRGHSTALSDSTRPRLCLNKTMSGVPTHEIRCDAPGSASAHGRRLLVFPKSPYACAMRPCDCPVHPSSCVLCVLRVASTLQYVQSVSLILVSWSTHLEGALARVCATQSRQSCTWGDACTADSSRDTGNKRHG